MIRLGLQSGVYPMHDNFISQVTVPSQVFPVIQIPLPEAVVVHEHGFALDILCYYLFI